MRCKRQERKSGRRAQKHAEDDRGVDPFVCRYPHGLTGAERQQHKHTKPMAGNGARETDRQQSAPEGPASAVRQPLPADERRRHETHQQRVRPRLVGVGAGRSRKRQERCAPRRRR